MNVLKRIFQRVGPGEATTAMVGLYSGESSTTLVIRLPFWTWEISFSPNILAYVEGWHTEYLIVTWDIPKHKSRWQRYKHLVSTIKAQTLSAPLEGCSITRVRRERTKYVAFTFDNVEKAISGEQP